MKKIIKLTESDLTRIVKRLIKEYEFSDFEDWMEDFYYELNYELNFDFDSVFGDDWASKIEFEDKLYNFMVKSYESGVSLEKVIRNLKRKPFFMEYDTLK